MQPSLSKSKILSGLQCDKRLWLEVHAPESRTADPQHTKRSVVVNAWLNSFLETNKVPTIWISNDADEFDPAILRRFSMAVAFEAPYV